MFLGSKKLLLCSLPVDLKVAESVLSSTMGTLLFYDAAHDFLSVFGGAYIESQWRLS